MTAPAIVYTDGACSGNPGPGGWAWAEPGGSFAAGFAAHTTNQRMELIAAHQAAMAHPGPIKIVTDSTYVMNCFVKRWYVNWLKSGWKNSQRKPVANRDLWEPFIELYQQRPDEITFEWVKGHSGDPMNDLVDQLAVQACMAQADRTGSEPPDPATLGPADEVPSRRARAAGSAGQTSLSTTEPSASANGALADGRVPDGRRLVVFGHRAADLGGYDQNPVADAVTARVADVLKAKRVLYPDLVVMTGIRLGAEMLAAEAAMRVAVPFVAILPYPEPEKVWSAASQERFRALIDQADSIVTLERKVPADRAAAGKALARRDGWLMSVCDEALLVWDGDDPVIAGLHRKLLKRLDEGDIWVVAPPT